MYQEVEKQGITDAGVRIGYCYENGIGVEVNQIVAAKWYQKEADAGNIVAAYRLGTLFHEGRCV